MGHYSNLFRHKQCTSVRCRNGEKYGLHIILRHSIFKNSHYKPPKYKVPVPFKSLQKSYILAKTVIDMMLFLKRVIIKFQNTVSLTPGFSG